jgi:hypothetical protein
MIDAGRQQKPILSVQAFVVCGIPPRLAVTGPQVRGIVNARNAAESLNRHHPLLEETLASPSGDDRFSIGRWNTDVSIHFGLNVVFPQFQVRISHGHAPVSLDRVRLDCDCLRTDKCDERLGEAF